MVARFISDTRLTFFSTGAFPADLAAAATVFWKRRRWLFPYMYVDHDRLDLGCTRCRAFARVERLLGFVPRCHNQVENS